MLFRCLHAIIDCCLPIPYAVYVPAMAVGKYEQNNTPALVPPAQDKIFKLKIMNFSFAQWSF